MKDALINTYFNLVNLICALKIEKSNFKYFKFLNLKNLAF